MRKCISLSLLCLLFWAGKCSPTEFESSKKNMTIIYEAKTRGSFSVLTIKKDSLIIVEKLRNKGQYVYPLSDSHWESIVSDILKSDYTKISQYHSSENKRAIDAARAAHITVLYDGKTYQSPVFDEGAPPKPLQKLSKNIESLYLIHLKNSTKNDN